jgi:hypothetical protein
MRRPIEEYERKEIWDHWLHGSAVSRDKYPASLVRRVLAEDPPQKVLENHIYIDGFKIGVVAATGPEAFALLKLPRKTTSTMLNKAVRNADREYRKIQPGKKIEVFFGHLIEIMEDHAAAGRLADKGALIWEVDDLGQIRRLDYLETKIPRQQAAPEDEFKTPLTPGP